MARNRKRAKERRARRPPSPVTAAAAHADAPDPTANATPDAELAEAQRSRGRPQPPVDPIPEPEPEPAPAELEPPASPIPGVLPARLTAERAGAGQELSEGAEVDPSLDAEQERSGHLPSAPAASGNRLVNFLQGSWRELQRVQWPDRRQVMQATGVVLGFVVVAGAFLGVADALAGRLADFILK